jgi:D-glycero-alpha-D-manno-heptose-7-phosphate kinase
MEEQGGAVLNVTIDKYSYSTLRLNDSAQITVQSLDYDIIAKYDLDKPLPYDGRLDLVKAVINRLSPKENTRGINVFMHTDAPPGSGLGSSSSLVVSLVGLFQHWLHLPLTNYEIAELAYDIERIDMQIQGGRQDQYATTFGGVNYIEFSQDATVVNPLRIPESILLELNYNLLLCYTGKTRLSAGIINSQVNNYVQRETSVLHAMEQLKAIAKAMKDNLLQGRLDEFGALLHEAWINKQKMAQEISTQYIHDLYTVSRQNGALGGKISGAGGGGFMMVYCPFERKHAVAEALEKLGGKVVDFHFDLTGLRTWDVRM